MLSKAEESNFKEKLFCMNLNRPVEVKSLDHALLELAEKIKPDEKIIKEHRGYAQTIAEIFKANSKYSIDRFFFAGSFGRRTNVLQSDADCIYFINDQVPPFNEIIEDFYYICEKPAVRKLFKSFNIEKNKNSINIEINGLEMDVVPATNFVKNLKKHQSLADVQQIEALEHIRSNPTENFYKFNSALSEAAVRFMKNRVGFVNEMARIAKYWFKGLKIDFGQIHGTSTFIELVAVVAARRGHRGNRRYNPHLKAFIRFLEKIIKFEELDVSFKLRCCRHAMMIHHQASDTTKPRVIDPVNPYQNFARNWCKDKDKIEALKSSAASTLARLHQLVLNPHCATGKDLVATLFH